MDYLNWNNLLAKHFFNEAMAGREVLLFVNDTLIEKLASQTNAGVEDFIQALKSGPAWARQQGFCQKALQSYEGWRNRNLEYPPYIAYLCFFVLAAGTQGDFSVQAFYPRLWKRLGEEEKSGMLPSFDKMLDLWDDLDKWSREDKHEELGRFVARWRGNLVNVGLPLSQTLLSEEERNELPRIFNQEDLDPMDSPSPDNLANLLIKAGRNIFERRTLRILEATDSDGKALKSALVDLVLDELENWDGAVDFYEAGKSDEQQIKAGLRICLEIDRVAQTAKAYFRFKTPRSFPEGGLNFQHAGNNWSCLEEYQGWSTSLRDESQIPWKILDGSTIDWEKGLQLTDTENRWNAKLSGQEVRLFMRGEFEGLSHWVESQRFSHNAEFLVATTRKHADNVMQWGTNNCAAFNQIKMSGLPRGWSLFQGTKAVNSCPGIPILSLPVSCRLKLKGGIKTGKGNGYLQFAPPIVVIENGSGKETINLDGKMLHHTLDNASTFGIPSDAPVGKSLKIEVAGHEPLLRKIIRLEEPEIPPSFDAPLRDRFGRISLRVNSEILVRGVGFDSAGNDFSVDVFPPVLPTHLASRIIFIGRQSGEISDWPQEGLPQNWEPVWALIKTGKKNWKPYFCGLHEATSGASGPLKSAEDQASQKKWREILWANRKVTAPPDLGSLRFLWKSYVEAAEHV